MPGSHSGRLHRSCKAEYKHREFKSHPGHHYKLQIFKYLKLSCFTNKGSAMNLDQIVIPFPEKAETRKGYPCRAFRWTFQILDYGQVIGFFHQYHLNGKWEESHTLLYSIKFHLSWSLEEIHVWWDGPHCMKSFGFFSISWYDGSCKKCRGLDG